MASDIAQMTARDIMTRRADTIGNDQQLHAAIETMVCLGLSALPVVGEDRKCVGVLTKTDILRFTGALEEDAARHGSDELAALFFGVSLDEITEAKVGDVMTSHVLSTTLDTPIADVADQMLRHEIHHVPVCNRREEVVGVISSMDLVKVIRDAYLGTS